MYLKEAHRLQNIREYYFAQKLKEIARLNLEGPPVINLGIGSPDLPPHPDVIAALCQSARLPQNHGYQPYRGLAALRQAMAASMQRWYGFSPDPDTEILPLMGSKEGIFHISMAFLNPGDVVLVPNPGYPAYAATAQLAGAEVKTYSLGEEGTTTTHFDPLQAMNWERVKMVWLNFPHMPTGRLATAQDFERWVSLAHQHQFLLIHDNPYALILQDRPRSLWQTEGAREVSLELHSLSKSHNLAGWRLGWLTGQAKWLDSVLKVKSNQDSGMFKALQEAAIVALGLPDDWYKELNHQYLQRKQVAEQLLKALGCQWLPHQKGMFLWARIPSPFADGFAFSEALLEQNRVFLTPGGVFGAAGQEHIRLSLCAERRVLEEALERVSKNKITKL
ncbi:MAG: aminotransferase class I/II-fold pyridoxal phosphate-dependent enzyme [Microscillaceae bacterium]|nr:aminotransferase class I/II-fold pyridoxal phosphate-dependent enzyme [Microscillaceae bacterium]